MSSAWSRTQRRNPPRPASVVSRSSGQFIQRMSIWELSSADSGEWKPRSAPRLQGCSDNNSSTLEISLWLTSLGKKEENIKITRVMQKVSPVQQTIVIVDGHVFFLLLRLLSTNVDSYKYYWCSNFLFLLSQFSSALHMDNIISTYTMFSCAVV